MRKHLEPYAFYDGPSEIGIRELDRIIQGLLGVGKAVLVPSYALPSRHDREEDRQKIGRRLAEFAEAGFIVRWDVEGLSPRIAQHTDWPAGTKRLILPANAYGELQERIRDGVGKQRDQLARGLGHAPGDMMSGVAEIVSLRSTLWTLGLARYFDSELLVSTEAYERRIVEPLHLLRMAEQVREPLTEKLLELNSISGLSLLEVRDIKSLQRRNAGIREAVDAISRQIEDSEPFEAAAIDQSARDLTDEHFRELLQKEAKGHRRLGKVSTLGTGIITIAGFAIPALSLASFAQPILEWIPARKPERRLLIFLSRLENRTA
jgi:hypothetical protein